MSRVVDVQLVFYDLEWSQDEIIQIGAVSDFSHFSQTILPSAQISPYVRKLIKLEVRHLSGAEGSSGVYDIVRGQFLDSVSPKEGLEMFLSWLEEVRTMYPVVLISHGNSDILVLHRNLARCSLDTRFYEIVDKFVDFRMYLASYCKEISHLSLSDLVKTYCKDQEFRLHCADEDSKALKKVFINLHLIRKIPSVEYYRNVVKLHKVYLKSVPLPSDSKEVKAMMKHLNPGSNEVLLSNSYTFGVYGILVSFPLFKLIEHPDNFKFEVPGYCVLHTLEKYPVRKFNSKKEDEFKERTRIDLACRLNKAYLPLTHYIQPGAKSVFNLESRVSVVSGKKTVLEAGTPVKITILVTPTDCVKVGDISIDCDRENVNICKILADLRMKQSQMQPGWHLNNISDAFKVSSNM